jgi:alpha-L-fucosidase
LRSLGRWMAQVGDVIRAAQPVSRSVAQPTNEPWVRWLETPDHLVALVDQTGEVALDVDDDAVTSGEAKVLAAPGAAGVTGGTMRVSVDELTDGPAAILISKH